LVSRRRDLHDWFLAVSQAQCREANDNILGCGGWIIREIHGVNIIFPQVDFLIRSAGDAENGRGYSSRLTKLPPPVFLQDRKQVHVPGPMRLIVALPLSGVVGIQLELFAKLPPRLWRQWA
jgi:hypothetical protein